MVTKEKMIEQENVEGALEIELEVEMMLLV